MNKIDKRNFLEQWFPSYKIGHHHLSLWERIHIDLPLLIGLLLIIIAGLLVLFSAASEDVLIVVRQMVRFGLAFGVMFVVAQISPSRLKLWAPWLYGIAVALLLAVLVIGYTGKGAQRWLNLGLFRFQPSELMKLALPMMIAWYMSDRQLPPKASSLALAGVILFVPVAFILKQPDLGTAIMVAVAGFGVLLFAGIGWRWLISGAVIIAAAAPVAWHFLHSYQRGRVLTFLNPERDPLGSGYHIIQSKIAIGSGGFLGKGWLNGTQSHLNFLPEHSTDFIYSVLGEEFGLLGGFILLSLYLLVTIRCFYIAYHAQDNFSRLLAGSLGFTFFVSVFVNIGMVSGILPVVGLPLPLFSYGGTSVVTLMASFGILMSISTHRKLIAT